MTPAIDRAAALRRLLTRCFGTEDAESQQGRCPLCHKPLYPYLSADGPAWTCRCAGPEREHYAALAAAARTAKKGRRR